MAAERQTSSLPPAQPSYVFRGHVAQIHSVDIVRRNTRLVTGDADGWVVFWSFESKRPVAVWRAHDGAMLGTAQWGLDKVATHGRDNSLKIWKVGATDEPTLSTVLPAENSTAHRPQPWLLHSLAVNTLNFCPFSMCHEAPAADLPRTDAIRLDSRQGGQVPSTGLSDCDAILVAVPAPDDKQVDIHQFPTEKLVYRVPRLQPVDSGMVMAVKLFRHPSNRLMVAAGYESGFTAVHLLARASGLGAHATDTMPEPVHTIYLSQSHSQPILSLDVSPDGRTFYTSSADAIIAAHRIPEPLNIQSAEMAFDGNLAHPNASSSSISQVPPVVIPSSNASSIVESPSTPLTFPKQSITPSQTGTNSSPPNTTSLLSAGLSAAPPQPKVTPPENPFPSVTKPQAASKSVQTKHAGQQSLRVRSDGRILATGGWDSRIRIYSAKSLKELAVLKWHKDGVYAVGFGQVLEDAAPGVSTPEKPPDGSGQDKIDVEEQRMRLADLAVRSTHNLDMISKLQLQRGEKMQKKHWVVAGAKDGKVSLWEIY